MLKKTSTAPIRRSQQEPPAPDSKAKQTRRKNAELKEARIAQPIPGLDRAKTVADRFEMKKPLRVDDSDSVLTVDAAANAMQVDTFVKVPKSGTYDGIIADLTQTDWKTARMEGSFESQMSLPPRTMAGAFGYHAARNGPMTLAKQEYSHSELDRETGEVVLSDLKEEEGDYCTLEQRRLRPSAGTALAGEMLTAMPPKVGLKRFPKGYKPEPGLLAADPTNAKLHPGSTMRLSGQSIEKLSTKVTSFVRPGHLGFNSPKGAKVDVETLLRVQNNDRAAIFHQQVVLGSGENPGTSPYSYSLPTNNNGSSPTIHVTKLKKAGLEVAPGEIQELLVEKQKGFARVEFGLGGDNISGNGAGVQKAQSGERKAVRYVVLDRSEGRRHAGEMKFFDGKTNELGTASSQVATPAITRTTSTHGPSGVSFTSKTAWSKLVKRKTEEVIRKVRVSGYGHSTKYRNETWLRKTAVQTVTREYDFQNVSDLAGRAELSIDARHLTAHGLEFIKINGKTLKPESVLNAGKGIKACHTGQGVRLQVDMSKGTAAKSNAAKVKVEVKGRYQLSYERKPEPEAPAAPADS
jgi:hypothetical protein